MINYAPTPAKVNILLVDDRPDKLIALEALLADFGQNIVKVTSGEEALRAVLQQDFAVILLDVNMPGMDGFETAALIRQRQNSEYTPIIFVTGINTTENHVSRGYSLGAVDYIFSPVMPEILRAKVAVFIDLFKKTAEIKRQGEFLLAEADKRKDEFLAMLAHELRNPLAAINSAIQLSRRGVSPEQEEWTKDIIERQVKHLARLMDDLLDVSRITRGNIQLKKEPVNLQEIIERAIEVVHPLIEAGKHKLQILGSRDPMYLMGDSTRLEQIVVNLLTNATKYSSDGSDIVLTTQQESGYWVIKVRDHGVGIAPEMLSHIFGLFVQVEGSLDRSQGGLGIGLTLVQRLTELHGGTITARSDGLGHGSEFTLRLPSIEATSQLHTPQKNSVTPISHEIGRRLLVVDDNVDTAHVMSELLKLSGYDVQSCHDGYAALKVASTFQPEVVLMDIGLPGIDGYEVAKKIRQDETLKKTILIAISGYGQEQDLMRSKESGFNHHMVKPLDTEVLLGLLAPAN